MGWDPRVDPRWVSSIAVILAMDPLWPPSAFPPSTHRRSTPKARSNLNMSAAGTTLSPSRDEKPDDDVASLGPQFQAAAALSPGIHIDPLVGPGIFPDPCGGVGIGLHRRREAELVRDGCSVRDDRRGLRDRNILHHLVLRMSDRVLPPYRNARLQPVVRNRKVEVLPVIKELVGSSLEGLRNGYSPVLSQEGSGGVYFMRDAMGCNYVAVFKPIDEEPLAVNNPRGFHLSPDGEGLKRGTQVGEGAFREVAAFILDHPLSGCRSFTNDVIGFAGVPPTAMVRCLHEGFNHPGGFDYSAGNFKTGSLQKFFKSRGSCEDMGPRDFPVAQVHKISVLDIRLANADRHAGNVLLCREGEEGDFTLVPIDHGYVLPKSFEDCTFDWLSWPQARQPYNHETVEYIRLLDAEEDIALLKFHGWELPAECARTLRISTALLKKCVERGFTPFAIGSIMCRKIVREASELEKMICYAEGVVSPGSSEDTFMSCISKMLDQYLENLVSRG